MIQFLIMVVSKNWLAKLLLCNNWLLRATTAAPAQQGIFRLGNGHCCSKTAAEEKQNQSSSASPFGATSCFRLKLPHPAHMHWSTSHFKDFSRFSFSTCFCLILREGDKCSWQSSILSFVLPLPFTMMFSIANCRMSVCFFKRMTCECCALCSLESLSWRRGCVCALRAHLFCYISGVSRG